MKVKFKGTIFFSLIVSFFLFMPKVEAEKLKFRNAANESQAWFGYTDKLKIGPPGKAVKKRDSSGNLAYCGKRMAGFADGKMHSRDYSWNNANTCMYFTYYNKGEQIHTDGDCSVIVGYILKQRESVKNKDWRRIQAALWTYLGHSDWGPQPYFYNDVNGENGKHSAAKLAWKGNSSVQKILKKAFKEYDSYKKNGGGISSSNDEEVKFDISYENGVKDLNFYFIPNGSNGSTCSGTSGIYKTKMITVTNTDSNTNSGKKIKISLSSNNSTVKICQIGGNDNSNCKDSLNVELSYNHSVKFYLKTSKVFGTGINQVSFDVSASYVELVTTSSGDVYDSKRYVRGNHQPLYVLFKHSGTGTSEVTHETSKTLNFVQTPLTHNMACQDLHNSGGTIYDNQNKVCANKSNNVKDYVAEFYDCSCTSLDLGDGKNVNIVVFQHLNFKFGNLSPNTIYPGGGFELYSTNKNQGTFTTYYDNIIWDYYDNLGGRPYYYNSRNTSQNDASSLEQQITNKLKQKVKDNVNLNFYAVNSNKYDDSDDKELKKRVTKKLDVKNNVTSDGKTITLNIDGIKLPDSYFSTNGTVSYTSNGEGDYSIKGGNKYYVPIKYTSSNNKFKFNIASPSEQINLSLISGMNFAYNANCDVNVTSPSCPSNDPNCNDTPILGVTYRAIDVNSPFPKATPVNWKNWYDVSSNKSRLSSSFSSNKLSYKIELNSNNLTRINAIPSSYSSWGSINKNGSSSFITSNIFSKRANSNSYCAIGKFSSTCDR